MTATAHKHCTCNRCGTLIRKGEPIRFEKSSAWRHRSGSGRRIGERTVSRPIHAHDCNGWDAAQARAKAAAEAARNSTH